MTFDKLSRQLRRDLGANPKKAAILGVMLLVAAYFWAPLIFGSRSDQTTETAADSQPSQAKENPFVAPQQKLTAKHAVGWEQLQHAIGTDPLMRTAAVAHNPHNPFVLPVPAPPEPAVAAATDEESIAATQPAPTAAPAEVDITIGSVLIGPRGRAVVVDGEVYRLGDTIPAGDERASGAGYRLISIEATKVEIEVGGARQTLEVARPHLAKGDRIRRAAQPAAP